MSLKLTKVISINFIEHEISEYQKNILDNYYETIIVEI